mmetsp:Transcript_31280/g.37227  ORF Transcript_31280/g.37227 Transcript_31280/m.37227 type:complete len:216 (+) Transcript_31280:65-712(+)|eukprot:CAMPEP_0198254926 /NCGR_PEP_ID=MMETSP1447-20131203/5166_1 /TAXON_ID=420782 /ORGANISM="Chaetoceros dichaeta, Strain CCMP1751" /LENGTH=215 /DNA_ID=CAMNT_0043941177 /DNA_START=38 /DNA_END=685 /DNA_ORIENTATION=+
MKISGITVLSIAATVGSSMAFAPTPSFGGKQQSMELSMSQSDQSTTRLQFLQTTTLATLLTTIASTSPANAAKYGAFGAGSPEVLDPKSAVIDADVLATDSVQNAIASLKVYLGAVNSMQSELKGNNQADIQPTLRGKFELGKLRADLNTANTAFDEDTQRGTDRIGRLILQDITELEVANKQKPGIERSEKRLTIMTKKLDKLSKAFSDYLAFF